MIIRVVLLAVALTVTAAAELSAPPDAKAKVDAVFSQFARPDSPGCAVGVAIGDKTVLRVGYGIADLEHRIPITPDTVFEAGSVSKQFTAAAILLLVQRHKISLDDPVRKYIPELPEYPGPTLTIRHLMNHTSGLRDWGAVGEIVGNPRWWKHAYTNHDALEIIVRQKSLNYPPGDRYSYTNSGYTLMAIIVPRITGKSLAELTRTEIFEPLQMRNTQWRDDFRRIVPNRATAYDRDSSYPGGFRMYMPMETAYGHGGLLTTIDDLLKWNGNFTHHKVGGKSFVEAQLQQARLNDGTIHFYAAGLQVTRHANTPEINHSGTTAGYNAWIARYPEQGLSVAMLCNLNTQPVPLGRALADVFLGAEAPTTTPKLPRSTELSAMPKSTPSEVQLSDFAGEYTSDEAQGEFRVAVEKGRLVLHQTPERYFPLQPESADTFQSPVGKIHFLRNTSGEITEMSVSNGRVFDIRFTKQQLPAPSGERRQ